MKEDIPPQDVSHVSWCYGRKGSLVRGVWKTLDRVWFPSIFQVSPSKWGREDAVILKCIGPQSPLFIFLQILSRFPWDTLCCMLLWAKWLLREAVAQEHLHSAHLGGGQENRLARQDGCKEAWELTLLSRIPVAPSGLTCPSAQRQWLKHKCPCSLEMQCHPLTACWCSRVALGILGSEWQHHLLLPRDPASQPPAWALTEGQLRVKRQSEQTGGGQAQDCTSPRHPGPVNINSISSLEECQLSAKSLPWQILFCSSCWLDLPWFSPGLRLWSWWVSHKYAALIPYSYTLGNIPPTGPSSPW